MIGGLPIDEIVWLVFAIVGAGTGTAILARPVRLAGLLSGRFGIGGGARIVPVLYEVFRILDVPEEVRMQLCIGTSTAIIVPTTVRSYRAHRAKGAVIPHVVRTWAAPAIAGVVVGAVTAAFAPGSVFK